MRPRVGGDRLQAARKSSFELQLHRMVIRSRPIVGIRDAGKHRVGITHDLSAQQAPSRCAYISCGEHLIRPQQVINSRVPLKRVGQLQLRIVAIDRKWRRGIEGRKGCLCRRQRKDKAGCTNDSGRKRISGKCLGSLPVSEIVENSEAASNSEFSATFLERMKGDSDPWCEIVVSGFIQALVTRGQCDCRTAVYSGQCKRKIAICFGRWWIDVPTQAIG